MMCNQHKPQSNATNKQQCFWRGLLMRLVYALRLMILLILPWNLYAADPVCVTGQPVEKVIDYSYKVVAIGDGISYQAWFEFDTITDVAQYNMEVTEFSLNTIPATLGRHFSYNTENPPTSIDEYALHRTNSGTLGVILFTGSAHKTNTKALEQLEGYYNAITGKAVVTYVCPLSAIDISVLASSVIEGERDNRIATYTATLTNEGTKDADDVQLTLDFPEQLHVQEVPDTRCIPDGKFAGGRVVCSGLSLAGGDVDFIDVITRVINASDLKDPVTMTASVAEDIDLSNNENSTYARPNLVGTLEETRQAMEIMSPYFDYLSPSELSGAQCNVYMDDIYSRLEALHASNPSVFENLSYSKITSGHYIGTGGISSRGHVGVVVYVKGSDYHKAGIVIHGTPTMSPMDFDLTSQVGTGGIGEHVNPLGFLAALNPLSQGTQDHGEYYRTPVSEFPGSPKPEITTGCGFEGLYPDNLGDFRIFNASGTPQCTQSNVAEPKSCPVIPKPVIVRTESPVDLLITNSRSQLVETLDGKISIQELESGIVSYPTQHEDGTFGWLMVLPEDNYDVQLLGTGSGPYKMTVVTYDENGEGNAIVYEGTTEADKVDNYKIDAAPTVSLPSQSSTGGGGSSNPGFLIMLALLLLVRQRLRTGNIIAAVFN